MSENNEIHAHVETHSRDCDGTYTSGYTITLNDSERAERNAADGVNDFHEIHFHDRVVAHVVNTYSSEQGGSLSVSRMSDNSVRLIWSEPTDEGHRNVEARICTDDCEEASQWQRDHSAEAAGY